MEERTVTITIDEQGKATLDLSGFSGASCEKPFEDFRGGDQVKLERKKPAYYANLQTEQEHTKR